VNDYDDLDELERELGPSLQLALRRAAGAITDRRSPTPLWLRHRGPGPAARGLDDAATEAPDLGVYPSRVEPRGPRWWLVAAAAAALAIVAGGLLVRATADRDGSMPATDPDVGQAPMRNGRIVAGYSAWPEGGTQPPSPGEPGDHEWDAFDQASGSFLYLSAQESSRGWVVFEDGSDADFHCAPSANCELSTFGPGPDEVTAPAQEPEDLGYVDRVQVMGLDGTVSDTLDISAATEPADGRSHRFLRDLAWSPDGTRLAVGTEAQYRCDPDYASCDVEVWVFDRDGGDPQLVYTEPATSDHLIEGWFTDKPVVVDLAWSPDGRRLGVVVAPTMFLGDDANRAWPRLVTVQFPPGQPAGADVLHTYDDLTEAQSSFLLPGRIYGLTFAFAWSPDGSRIAVTSGPGVTEISAADGHVLARHRGDDVLGPLAWLPDR
jgi:hypothetical protein